eukprot:gene15867-21511_t
MSNGLRSTSTKIPNMIDADNPHFLKLVTEHIQIFERHWRRMVVDIREGKLNRNLTEISKEARIIFETSNIPRPKLATKLDQTFRELGFHKKVLGKDIIIQSYARKKVRVSTALSSPIRRNSLRTKPTPSHQLMSRTTTANTTGILSPMASKNDVSKLMRSNSNAISPDSRDMMVKQSAMITAGKNRNLPPIAANLKIDTKLSTTLTSSPSKTTSPSRITSKSSKTLNDIISPNHRSPSPNHLLLTSSKDLLSPTPSLKLKRHGSESDLLRPVTAEEVNETHYELQTAPRDYYKHAFEMVDGNHRFVCPFPACGMSFNSKDACFAHLPVHEQRTRLYAPTPLPDSHLSSYWPTEVPWLTMKKFTKRAIPPGSIKCTQPNCMDVFSSKLKLENHLRIVHKIAGPSSISQGYFNVINLIYAIPPTRPPVSYQFIPIAYCQLHIQPLNKCQTCMEVDASDHPKPPLRYFEKMTFDLDLKQKKLTELKVIRDAMKKNKDMDDDDTVNSDNGSVKKGYSKSKSVKSQSNIKNHGSGSSLTFIANDDNCGIIASYPNTNGLVTIKGKVVSLILDRNNDGWIGISLLLNYHEAINRNINLQYQDMHPEYELVDMGLLPESLNTPLIKSPIPLNKPIPSHFMWISVSDVISKFDIHHISEKERNDKIIEIEQMQKQKKSKSSKKNLLNYYIRVDEISDVDEEEEDINNIENNRTLSKSSFENMRTVSLPSIQLN